MAFAAATVARDKGRKDGDLISVPMAAEKIYKGSLVFANANGYASNTPTASEPFIGVAHETVDNSGGSAGDLEIRVWTTGVFNFIIAASADNDFGVEVYCDNAVSNQAVNVVDPGVGPKVGRLVSNCSDTDTDAWVRIDGYAMAVNADAS